MDAYEGVRHRIGALAAGLDPDAPVPGCPGWRVRDVLAHLAGLCEDWVAGRLDGYATDAWTAAQIARFDGCSVDEIIDRWSTDAQQFAVLEPVRGWGPPARWGFGDAVSHEADLHGIRGTSRVPDEVVAVAVKAAISRWRDVLSAAELPTLQVRLSDGRDYLLGRDEVAVVVTADAYEVFRALAGRRSRTQIERWDWSADPTRYVDAGLAIPFRWAAHDLVD